MLNLFYDFIPVLLFFIAFKCWGIYTAVVVGMIATGVQVILTRVLRKRWDKQQIITLAVFLVFGGMTLYFHNPLFVKWKPTVVFWLLAFVFLGSHLLGAKPLVQRMMEPVLIDKGNTLPQPIWKKLNLFWILFFSLLGAMNIFVAYHFTTEGWVNFKFYGITVLLLIFSLLQAIYLMRHLVETSNRVGEHNES